MTEPTRVHHGITSILTEAGVVTDAQVEQGLARQRETGMRIGETLVEIGAATEEDIGWALSRQLGLPFVDLQPEALDAEWLNRFPAGLLYRLHAVPLLRSDDGLSVAFSDPTDAQAVAHLEALAECPVHPSITTPSAIRRVLAPRLGAHAAAGGPAARPTGAETTVIWDRSGAQFLHFHLHAARRAGAQAVHFVPEPDGVRVYHRVPAGLSPVAVETPEAYEALLTQLELLGAPVADVARDLHHVAHVACPSPGTPWPLEVALMAHAGATAVTLRLPASDGVPATLDALGLDPVDAARVRELLHRPAGLVVVSGPDGSGCTTTLACLLAEALREDRSAMIFGAGELPAPRDRVVFALHGARAQAAWADLVSAHTPDVVVLDDVVKGEDLSALTAGAGMGRLVLARADWGDTFALLESLASRPHARSATASRLLLVIQQRLLPPGALADGGPRTRHEVLVVSDALRAAIRSAASARALRDLATAEGFRDLEAVLRDDVRAGRLRPDAAARALSI
jgi:hypothetical protein